MISMNNIIIVKNIKYANAITHAGKFHVDEVLATIILSKVIKPLKVYRADSLPKDVDSSVLVYDIGLGKFDHHQKNRNGTRDNGVPYASVGLIWKEFGSKIVAKEEYPFLVWQFIDRDFIQGVDAADNGVLPKINYPTNIMGLNHVISSFNPLWNSKEDSDMAFMKAISFASVIFDNVYAEAVAKSRAKQIVEEAIYRSSEHIMVLPQHMPWREFVLNSCNKKASDIYFVIYPSLRRGYIWECVPKKFVAGQYRKTTPSQWHGLYDEAIRKETGIKTAIFCHMNGCIGGAETFEDTVEFAKLALKS